MNKHKSFYFEKFYAITKFRIDPFFYVIGVMSFHICTPTPITVATERDKMLDCWIMTIGSLKNLTFLTGLNDKCLNIIPKYSLGCPT